MTKSEMEHLYNEVGNVLQDSLNNAKSIHLVGDEEQGELTEIVARLDDINSSFQTEIEKLQSSSEWDKFCIAFFGETNAGKSTIIESLRIIYDEEKRRAEMIRNKKECERMLSQHCDKYQGVLQTLETVNHQISESEKKHAIASLQTPESESKRIEESGSKIIRIIMYIGCTVVGFLIAFVLSILELI